MLSCEPLNILLKSQEVRQLFEFHKEKQMWFQGLTLMEVRLGEELEALPFSEAATLKVFSSKGSAGWAWKGKSKSFMFFKKRDVTNIYPHANQVSEFITD